MRGEQAVGQAQGFQQRTVPASLPVGEERPAGVGRLAAGDPRQPEAQPVLGLQRPARGLQADGLVFRQPEQDRASHAGRGRIAQAFEAVGQGRIACQLGDGTGVQPQDGGSQGVALGVGEHHAVHLPRKADAFDGGASARRQGLDARRERLQPDFRVDFAPAGMGADGVVRGTRFADRGAVGVEQQGFGRAGAEVKT